MTINNKFRILQTVFLIHDAEQEARMITAIQVDPNGLSYFLTLGTTSGWHFEAEISDKPDTLKRIG